MSGDILKPCRECGAPCSVQTFSHPEKGIEATLWMCSKHRSLGGDCPNETAYLDAAAWNTRALVTPSDAETDELIERLREAYCASLGSHQDRKFLDEAVTTIEALRARLGGAERVIGEAKWCLAKIGQMHSADCSPAEMLERCMSEAQEGYRAASRFLSSTGGDT